MTVHKIDDSVRTLTLFDELSLFSWRLALDRRVWIVL